MKIERITLESGVAVSGTATAQTSQPIRGKILRVSLKYDSGSGAGTQVALWGGDVDSDISDQDSEGYLFVLGNTNAVYYPRIFVSDLEGEQGSVQYALGKDVNDHFTCFSPIHLKILNATEGKGVTAEILVERD